MFVESLECFACGARHRADRCINLCACGKPLAVRYDLAAVARAVTREDIRRRPAGTWRWREMLPLPPGEQPVSLGEGDTPLIHAQVLGQRLGLPRLFVKDEACNPTGSFKARGMSVAVTMARHFGQRKLVAPSAGNAGGALAAYAAAGGLDANVFMPADVPLVNRLECELSGAHVTLIDGLIDDCGREVARRKDAEGWFDVSTLKEPYRVEGKKIMGYELAEQFDWALPDVIVYPTGGGTGLVGMAKAFDEMEALGWIGTKRPRFVAVQSSGCAPIVRAFDAGREFADRWDRGDTVAAGLRVPQAIADFIILREVRRSRGCAVMIEDNELLAAMRTLATLTGVCACPEGGACLAAARKLRVEGWIKPEECVVLFNTGSGMKYVEAAQSCLSSHSRPVRPQ